VDQRGDEVSLAVITSRQWSPWPKIHWVIRRRTIEKNGTSITVVCEDYELIWPWMRCMGVGIHKGG
jgi:hypothetical protein